MLEAGEGFLQVIEVRDDGAGFEDLLLEMDRSKLESVGVKAVERLLLEMQVRMAFNSIFMHVLKKEKELKKLEKTFNHFALQLLIFLHEILGGKQSLSDLDRLRNLCA